MRVTEIVARKTVRAICDRTATKPEGVERIGGEAIFTVQSHTGLLQKLTAPIRDVSAALDYMLRWLASDRSKVF